MHSLLARRRTGAWRRLTALVIGLVLPQAILYGPSLVGWKILLPLDILAQPGHYLPATSERPTMVPHHRTRSDLVLLSEPTRQFAVAEARAGRWSNWTPYEFAGTVFVAARFSPFGFLSYWFRSPTIHAWLQVILALVAGSGAYVFFRDVLRVGFWPAAVIAWCYPLTGYVILWQGFFLPMVACWLPWLLWAVDRTIRGTSRWAMPLVALFAAVVLHGGHVDIAGLVLLVSGLYALWCLFDEYGFRWLRPGPMRGVGGLVLGWGLGFLMAAPLLLPFLEYTSTGSRLARRSQGDEERPPVGLAALPQTVLPHVYGSQERGNFPIFPPGPGNLMESSAATYAGLLVTLLAAPLAFCSHRHRSINRFWVVLAVIAMGWQVNVPGLVHVFRMPGLNMLSFNRFVFATAFAVLALAAIGLDVLAKGQVRRRWWFCLPALLLVGLGGWCVRRALVLPEPIASQLAAAINAGSPVVGISTLADVRQVQGTFVQTYALGALWCGLGLIGWLLFAFRRESRPWHVPALGAVLLIELLMFAYGRNVQCDPSMYYPRIPVLEKVAQATPGRVLGYACLPAVLAQTHGLRDIRGYDAVDPARLMDLMDIARDPRYPQVSYAKTQWMMPKILEVAPPQYVRLSPILDMFNVRYLIFRGVPSDKLKPEFAGGDYWVLINRSALPRVWVPRRVEIADDDRDRLKKLADAYFDPREVAYVESPPGPTRLELPKASYACSGSAQIVDEIPTRIQIAVDMQTAGLLVLADLWDKGWKAYLDGQPVPILRTNHAVRGVMLPAGKGTLDFRYQPASFTWGLRLGGLGLLGVLGWCGLMVRKRRPATRVVPTARTLDDEPQPFVPPPASEVGS